MTRGNAERENRTLFIREKGSGDTNEEGRRKRAEAVKRNGIGPEVALWVDWMEVERVPNAAQPKSPGIAALGIPLDDQSPAPSTTELRAALERFATEAFRGSAPPEGYVTRLLSLYEVRRKAGDKPSAALRETLSVVLTSPPAVFAHLLRAGHPLSASLGFDASVRMRPHQVDCADFTRPIPATT